MAEPPPVGGQTGATTRSALGRAPIFCSSFSGCPSLISKPPRSKSETVPSPASTILAMAPGSALSQQAAASSAVCA